MFDRKIIIITPWFGEFAGGAEVQAKSMAIQLNHRGIETIIFTTCSKSPYDSWWENYYDEGVYEVYRVQTHRFATNRTRQRYETAVANLSQGDDLTEKDKEDFFLCGINSEKLLIALGKYIDDNYEIIALPYFHGLTHSVINHYSRKISLIPCFHNEPQFYWKNIEKLLANSKHVFFNSDAEKEMAIKIYGHAIGRKVVESPVTGEGVELEWVDVMDNGKINKLSENYFVYVGRKERGKNVPLLCDWFEKYLKEFNRSTKLLFLGGGDRNLLPQNVNFVDLGFVSEEDKCSIIKNSNGVINLSDNESFSLVIMEGWLLGVPVIVSANCAVTKDHVRRANGGLYVENCDEFALALEYLEENKKTAKLLASNGRAYVSMNFSFDTVLSKYLRELEK